MPDGNYPRRPTKAILEVRRSSAPLRDRLLEPTGAPDLPPFEVDHVAVVCSCRRAILDFRFRIPPSARSSVVVRCLSCDRTLVLSLDPVRSGVLKALEVRA